ncbi:hypothetical protein PR048_009007 [Dryococelus australis]|uniref:Uncharacterized protein n=1 Tax=Dryococelus australis TaxID=614101 RepID=A0ABQ9I0J3_9NEOP|nr:hypothetical protein PR048_009007 [Dryococelus australis]
MQFWKLDDVEIGKKYRVADIHQVNTTYGKSITCVLDGEFRINLPKSYMQLIKAEDTWKSQHYMMGRVLRQRSAIHHHEPRLHDGEDDVFNADL